MSQESTKELLSKLKTDEEFRNKILAVEDVDERIELIRSEGFKCVKEDFRIKEGELDDEALNAVSGGGWGRFCMINIGEPTFGCC